MFIIYKTFLDSFENVSSEAVREEVIYWTEDEEKAKKFCEAGKILTKNDCWALFHSQPEYRYVKIKIL